MSTQMHPWKYSVLKRRVPVESLKTSLSAVTDDPPACHCGKAAHRIVHDKSGKGFIGFCASHVQEAEDLARSRCIVSEDKKIAQFRIRKEFVVGSPIRDTTINHKDNWSRHVANGRRK